MKKICGVCPPVITIFDSEGNIDIEANKKQADFLIDKGVDGLAYLGTSGEFSTLTMEEKKQFIFAMNQYVNHRVNVIAGVGDPSLKNTLKFLSYVEEIGVDAALVVNPYFNIYSENMIEAYYDEVAEATKLPIIIYNIPSLTGYNFSTEIVTKLVKKHKNIMGIKDTVGDPEHIRDMMKVKEYNKDFSVFCAYENQTLGLLVHGIDGFINATANFAPEFTVGIYQEFKKGNLQEANKWYEKLTKAMDIYTLSDPLYLACKQAVYERVLGKDGFERLPALSLSKEVKEKVHNKLKEFKLI